MAALVEQFANKASTTLGAAITSTSSTSITVSSSSGFPAVGQFRILIDSEILIVTAISGTTWTVSRGAELTTAATHLNGAEVDNLLTNGALQQFRADNVSQDTFANLPTAGIAGRIYLPTDSPIMCRDNGTSWDNFIPGIANPGMITDPNLSTWAWVNQQTSTVTSSKGGLYLTQPVQSGDELSIYETTLTSNAAGHSVVFLLRITGGGAGSNNWHAGLSLRDPSGGTGVATFAMTGGNGNTAAFFYFSWTNPTTFSSQRASTSYSASSGYIACNQWIWVRRLLSGSNQIWQISGDGLTWASVIVIGSTDSLAGTPTTIGFYSDNVSSKSDNVSIHLLSFAQF